MTEEAHEGWPKLKDGERSEHTDEVAKGSCIHRQSGGTSRTYETRIEVDEKQCGSWLELECSCPGDSLAPRYERLWRACIEDSDQ